MSAETNSKARVKLRGFTSVLAMLSFAILTVSGVLLFFTPPGRIANWSDYALWGLTKTQWQVLHIAFSLLFLVAALLHVILNWRVMIAYFRNRSTRRFAFRWQWIFPLLVCAGFFWGAVAGAWPFNLIAEWRWEIKHSAASERTAATQPAQEVEQRRGRQYRGGRGL